MEKISLPHGLFALVDDDEFEELNKHRWCIQREKYPARMVGRKIIYMHRLINNTPKGFVTDHIDGNPLNNTKSNLRTCTQSQNLMNTRLRCDNKYGFKGVYKNRPGRSKQWIACIQKNNKKIILGYFNTILEAKNAYDNASLVIHNEFARKNKA